MAKQNSAKQINKAYHARMKQLLKGQRESEIFEALSAGKNSYMRMDRLESSSFDKSWIEVIEGVIFDLGEIIANPRMYTKTEGVLTPVELARKITSESVQHLANHSQYVKEVDEYGNVIPSKVLSISADDDLHTYENRFIATLVRRLLLFIEKRYEYVSKFAELANEEILFFKNKSIVDGAEVEIETKIKVSYKNDDEAALTSNNYIERIKETRRYILYFYNSPFMKALKNEKDVRNPIIQTNIIRKNPKYNHCYNVYKFLETYDRLGVNYKIDEQYSEFNDEELKELNRTIFANYITLRGKDRSKNYKPTSKVYKPKILKSMDDESFIYGPLFEGPIEFVRVDDQYRQYLESKVKKDLPLHPTKKEKEYYEDEYAAKAEHKQDEKQMNDLLKRRQKEVNEFERQVRSILAKRENARLKLLELEKQAIKQEENDLLDAMRREIIAGALAELDEMAPEVIEEPVEETPVEEAPVEEPFKEERIYVPTVSFEEAADEIWPQLNNPTPLPKEEAPIIIKPVPVKKAKKAEPEPVKEEKPVEDKPVQKVYVPTVSFNDAADEVWPQLKNPQPLPKEEAKPVVVEVPVEEVEEEQPAKKEYVPTVSFNDAADEIWPQLNNPTPLKKEEAPVVVKAPKKAPAKKIAPSKKVKPVPAPGPVKDDRVYEPTVSFNDAADEIWPQLNNPKPLPKEEAKVVEEVPQKEEKPAPAKKAPAKKVPAKKAEPKAKPEEKKPEPAPKKEEPKAKPAPKKAAKKQEPKKEKVEAPKAEPKKEQPKPAPAPAMPPRQKIPGRFIVKTSNGYYVGKNKYSIDKDDAYIFDDFNLANDIKKEQGGKVIKL